MGKSRTSDEDEERATTPVLGGRVRHALTRIVDFGEPRRLHAHAALRFKERRFNDAFQAARDAVSQIEGESRDYVETGMALAIASACRILETSEGTTAWALKVSRLLGEVMHTFERGSFAEAATLLKKLGAAVTSLYEYEMDRHRNHVAAHGRAIAETRAMGGETTLSSRKLRRAVLALAQDDREAYLEVIEEVDALVKQARARRVDAIQEGANEVEGPLKEGLAMALETGDFISSNFLLLASQEMAISDPQAPSSTNFEDGRKVDLLNSILDQIESVVEQAEGEGLDATPVAEELDTARSLIEAGEHAQALVKGRYAYQLLKALRRQDGPSNEGMREEASPPEAEAEFAEGPPEDDAGLLGEDEETRLWCLECGSVQVGMGPDGDLRCLRCDAKVPATFP